MPGGSGRLTCVCAQDSWAQLRTQCCIVTPSVWTRILGSTPCANGILSTTKSRTRILASNSIQPGRPPPRTFDQNPAHPSNRPHGTHTDWTDAAHPSTGHTRTHTGLTDLLTHQPDTHRLDRSAHPSTDTHRLDRSCSAIHRHTQTDRSGSAINRHTQTDRSAHPSTDAHRLTDLLTHQPTHTTHTDALFIIFHSKRTLSADADG